MKQRSAPMSTPAQPRLTITSLNRKASPEQPCNTTRKTSFLDLPGELRNRVYRLALGRPRILEVVNLHLARNQIDSSEHHNLRTGGPPILRASKEIRREVTEIYYLENTFTFTNATLNLAAIDAFHDQLGPLVRRLRRVRIFRTLQIGDMKKPAEVCFTARTDPKSCRVVLRRQPYDRRVFVPGKVKLKSKYVEPCRCDVDRLAKKVGSPKRINGLDLVAFLEAYSALIGTEAREVMLDICKVCDTIRRD